MPGTPRKEYPMSAWQLSRFWQALTRNPDRRGRYATPSHHYRSWRYLGPMGLVTMFIVMATWFYQPWSVTPSVAAAGAQSLLMFCGIGTFAFMTTRGWSNYLHPMNWTTHPLRITTTSYRPRRRTDHSVPDGWASRELVGPRRRSEVLLHPIGEVPRHPTMGHYDVRGK